MIKIIHRRGKTFSFKNIKIKIIKSSYKVTEVKWHNNLPIVPKKLYVGITTMYLLKGGDGFTGFMDRMYPSKYIKIIGNFRKNISIQLARMKQILKGYYNPQNPRIIYVDANETDL
jgi:hypothetical protein